MYLSSNYPRTVIMYRPEYKVYKRQARFALFVILYAWGSHLRAVPGRLSVSCFGFPAGNSYFWSKCIAKPKPTGEPPPLGLEWVMVLNGFYF